MSLLVEYAYATGFETFFGMIFSYSPKRTAIPNTEKLL